jgi:excisionase family DNA binding protein
MVSEEQRRIPHVRELAVIGDYAVIGGHSAEFLGRLLAGYPGGIERLLARSRVPPKRREDILRAVGALVLVGANWRLEHEGGSASGTAPGAGPNSHAPSKRDGFSSPEQNGKAFTASEASPFLGTSEVASVLGVSTRMVRRLTSTGALRGQRDAGGRWQFAPADVAAERTRRMNATGDRDVA